MRRVQLHGLLGCDIVVGIAIVGYQGTPGVITCQLKFFWVNFRHRGYDHIAIVHYHSLVFADGGLLDLRVNILVADYNATACSGQLDSMSALGSLGVVRHRFHHLAFL